MVRYIQFNTGRPYTVNGQLIQCRAVSNSNNKTSTVAFYDTSRCIVGEVVIYLTPEEAEKNPSLFAEQVMEEYDDGHYNPLCFCDDQIRDIIQHFTQRQ